MPNCEVTKRKCGVACTDEEINYAYYKDCKTGRVGTGATYTEAIQSATRTRPKCAGLMGETLKQCQAGKSTLFPGVKKIHPISKIKTVGGSGSSKPGVSGTGRGTIEVQPGSRFDDKKDNWKDTEKLLGDPEPDDDPGTVGGFDEGCFGLPIPCPLLAVGVGAVIVLLVALR